MVTLCGYKKAKVKLQANNGHSANKFLYYNWVTSSIFMILTFFHEYKVIEKNEY